MAFGGLDLEALRAELDAARQERVVLLQHAADLDAGLSFMNGGSKSPSLGPADGFQGFPAAPLAPAWSTPTAADAAAAASRGPRKLSWGTPRGPTGLAADTSVFAPSLGDAWEKDWGAGRDGGSGDEATRARPSFPLEDPTPAPAPAPALPSAAAASTESLQFWGQAAGPVRPDSVAVTNSVLLRQGAGGEPSAAAGPATPVAPMPVAAIAGAPTGTDPAEWKGLLGFGSGAQCNGISDARVGSSSHAARDSGAPPPGPGGPGGPGGSSNSSPSPRSACGSHNGSVGGGSVSSSSSSGSDAASSDVAGPRAGSAGCRQASPAKAAPPGATPIKLSGGSGAGGGGLTIPLKLGSSGFGGIAAAASRAAAAAATVATTGQPAVPWAAHHTHNATGAGVDLEAHRRMVLKEVLAAVLGEPPNSAKLEHMRLDVEFVAALLRQRTTDAVAAAASEAEERIKAGQAERQAKAVKAAEEKGEKALAELKKTLEEEKRRIQAKMDKFRGQLADVEKEKKSLSGKSGQQSRELREAKEALMLSKQLLSTAQNTAEVKTKALAKAQAELERLKAEMTATAEARDAAVAAAQAEAEAAKQEAAAVLEAEAARVRAEAEAVTQSLAAAHNDALEEAKAGTAALRGALAEEVEALAEAAGQLAGAVAGDLAATGEDLAGLKADLEAMRSSFREEVQAMREAAYAAIGGFHAACRTAAQAHAERSAQLLAADEQLRKLGPSGLAALMTEAEALRKLGPGGVLAVTKEAQGLREQLAEAKARVERLEREWETVAAAQRQATTEAEQRARELQAMSAANQDLTAQLNASRAELTAAAAECLRLREAAEQLRADLRRAQDEAAERKEAVLHSTHSTQREVEAARAAAQRHLAEAEKARREVQRWQEVAAEGVSAGRHEAVVITTTLLADLRDRYFEALPSGTEPTRFDGAGAEGAEDGGADYEPRGGRGAPVGVSELEAAAGFRLPDPAQDWLAAALETFLSRHEAVVSSREAGERDSSPRRAYASSAATGSSPQRSRPGDHRPGRHAADTGGLAPSGTLATSSILSAAASGGWQRPLVAELLGLEGCLLAALVDRWANSSGGSVFRGPLRGLISDLVDALSAGPERQALGGRAERGRKGPSGSGSSHAYYGGGGGSGGGGGGRRGLNATAPSPGRGGADRGPGNWRPAFQTGSSGGGGGMDSAPRHALVPYGSGGVAEPEVAATPRPAGQRRGAAPRSTVRRSTDTDAVVGPPPQPSSAATLYGGDADGSGAPGSECMLPPLPNPYSGQGVGGSPLQAPDMDELMDVLQALDESSLRRSRGALQLAQARRQGAWAAVDSPSGAAAGEGGPAARRGPGGGLPMGTPPRAPGKGSGGGFEAYGGTHSSGTTGRSMGRAVSWSGPGGGAGTGAAVAAVAGAGTGSPGGFAGGSGVRNGGRVGSADAPEVAKRGSPYLAAAAGNSRGIR